MPAEWASKNLKIPCDKRFAEIRTKLETDEKFRCI